jgi:hypothetical protein
LSRKQERKVRPLLASPLGGQALVLRARMVLLATEDLPNVRITVTDPRSPAVTPRPKPSDGAVVVNVYLLSRRLAFPAH